MSDSRRIFAYLGAAAVAVALSAIGIMTLLRPQPAVLPPSSTEPVRGDSRPPPSFEGALSNFIPSGTAEAPEMDGGEAIGQILGDNQISHEEAALQMLALLPRLSPEQQEEAAEHIANLSNREVAGKWTGMLVKNQLPARAAEVLYSALYNEDEELFLPAMAAISDNARHPFHDESVDTLDILIGPLPEGSNWSALAQKTLQEEAATPDTR